MNNLLKGTLAIISFLLLISSGCKKETIVKEKIDISQSRKNLSYNNGTKITEIPFEQFKSKVNSTLLGPLKNVLGINSAPKKLMSIDLPETYKGFTVENSHVKMIVGGGHTSYVFPVKLSSPHAVTFQNLTIDESSSGTFAFITSYTPTKEWIDLWKEGKQGKFDGLIEVTPINLDNGSSGPNIKESFSLNTKKISSLSPLPKTALVQSCSTINYYYTIPYNCASGQHGPGENCGLTGSDRAGYANISNSVTTCYDVEFSPTNTGGGGGGNTTPNPNPDYDPCPKTLPTVETNEVRGLRIAVAAGTPICDLAPLPTPPRIDTEPIAIDPNLVVLPYNKLCASTFVFSTVVSPDPSQSSRGWKEAAVSNLQINVLPANYLENIWDLVTTGSVFVSGTFNLTVGVPGDLPNTIIAKETALAANVTMIQLEKSYGTKGLQVLIQSGTLGSSVAKLMQIQLASVIPGARVSNALSGRTPPSSPKTGTNCQ
ncbi:MAG: hypothetical protein EOO43_08705 [Flavobacterium sp.]|nr:MAG: hypothetical protein EOO43_08705 [Flavobacterium sp.]